MSGHKKKNRTDPLTVALPPAGTDTHAHLGDPAFNEDREAVLERARACGVISIANVCLHPETFPDEAALFARHPEVFFLLGVHPDDARDFTDTTLSLIAQHIANYPSIRAVGEIGLDYSREEPECTPHDLQKSVFRAQLALAKEKNLPVAIHCRDAEDECIPILEEEGFRGYPLIWHCFGGNTDLIHRIIDNDWYVSVPGTITFKNNPQAREAIPLVPDNRILMETDCPYLSPDPWRGTRNEPAYTVFTIRTMAACRNTTPEALWELCGHNARTVYRLD